ncbi:MAG: hypothetical protein ACXVY3_06200 [Gaiellaceae bacterium]
MPCAAAISLLPMLGATGRAACLAVAAVGLLIAASASLGLHSPAPRMLPALMLAAAGTAAAAVAGLGDPGSPLVAGALTVPVASCLTLTLATLAAELQSALRRHGVIDVGVLATTSAALALTFAPRSGRDPSATAALAGPGRPREATR